VTLHRRDVLRAALAVPLLAACAKKKGGAKPAATPTGPVALEDVGPGSAPGLTVGDAEAELLVGSSRYAFGLVGPDGPLSGAQATVYVGADPAKPATATVGAVELTDPGLSGRGLYVATVPFPKAGEFFVAVVAKTATGSFKGGTKVDVATRSKSPVAGQKAPAVQTPTTAHPMNAHPLCSRRPKPCSMHAISLDAAVRNGKPTVVVFAAPAFCQTELCGPDVEIVQGVADKHRAQANFIHVEAYTDATTPTDGKLAPALKAFHFDSEPWLYVIDKHGVVSSRLSGAFAASELASRLAAVGVS
jgi:hypothetical protein